MPRSSNSTADFDQSHQAIYGQTGTQSSNDDSDEEEDSKMQISTSDADKIMYPSQSLKSPKEEDEDKSKTVESNESGPYIVSTQGYYNS